MSKTPSSGNDAQDESNQNLAGIVMIGTFWLVGWSASQLVHQPNPPQKLNENRQPAKGSHCTHRVTDFNLSGTKKRVKFLPIVLFRRLRRIFHHNLFSHNRLEQNESPLPRANFGFQVYCCPCSTSASAHLVLPSPSYAQVSRVSAECNLYSWRASEQPERARPRSGA